VEIGGFRVTALQKGANQNPHTGTPLDQWGGGSMHAITSEWGGATLANPHHIIPKLELMREMDGVGLA